MADAQTNLPIWSRSTSDPVIVSADTAANDATNPIYISLTDGTDTVLVDASGNMNVILASNSGTDIGDVDVLSVVPGVGATNLGKAEDSAHTTGDTGVFALAVRDDAGGAFGADGDYVPFSINAAGELRVTSGGANTNIIQDDSAFTPATSYVGASGYFADETATDSVTEGDIGAARMTLDRKQIMVIADATTDSQRLGIDASGYITSNINGTVTVDATNLDIRDLTSASDNVEIKTAAGQALDIDASGYITSNINGSVTVTATDLDIRNLVHATDSVTIGDGTETLNITAAGEAEVDIAAQSLTALKISKDANANTETNPIYVHNVDSVVSGVEVVDYDTTASVAKDATDNHDYTVTGSTFLVLKCLGSASGAQKIEIQSGPVATLVSQAVQFTSMATPNWVIEFDGKLEVPVTSTGTVRIARTNRDNQSMDVYSTIIGNEVA